MKRIFTSVLLLVAAVNLHAVEKLPKSCKVGDFVLGCQAYTFNRYTAFEAIDKTAEAGGKTIELFLWQKFSPDEPKVEVNALMSEAHLQKLKAKLKERGIRATSAYFGNKAFEQADTETALRKVFDFAKKLDMVALTGEPPESGFDVMEKLCKEYDLRFCLHNHRGSAEDPKYKYWNPEYTVALMQGRDKRMGFCLDTGHLVRSGLDPVEALRKMQGRVFSLHLKDPISRDGQDAIFGQGVGNVAGVLKELKRQKFDGFISIEYESNWTNSVPDVKQCVEFVRNFGKKK